MKTLIKEKTQVLVKNVEEPKIKEKHVIVQMKMVGLCRTDILVSKNELAKDKHIILGHEGSGIVSQSKSIYFKKNDRVIINPYFSENPRRSLCKRITFFY